MTEVNTVQESNEELDPKAALEDIVPSEVLEEAITALAVPEVAREAGHRMRALALALAEIARREDPQVRNKNKYSTYFGYGPQEWCADFVSWAHDRAGNRDKKAAWGYPSGVRGIRDWAMRENCIVSQPEAGDLFAYKNNGHIGIVAGVVDAGYFVTVEGNTSGPDGSGTTWVYVHVRRNDGRYEFIRTPWG